MSPTGGEWKFIDAEVQDDFGDALWVRMFFECNGISMYIDFNINPEVVYEYGPHNVLYNGNQAIPKPHFAEFGIDKLIEQYEPLARIMM